jgi:hypothetical protein
MAAILHMQYAIVDALKLCVGRDFAPHGIYFDHTVVAIQKLFEYDLNITRNDRTYTSSRTSDWYEDFLAVAKRDRAARLAGTPPLPKPCGATVNGNGFLTWSWYPTADIKGPPPATQQVPVKLCFDFARLADGSEEEIRRFAAKWGPLGLDKGGKEHIDDLRNYARLAKALLRFSAELLSGGAGAGEDWNTICESIAPGQNLADRAGLDSRFQMAIIASAVNTWFAKAHGHGILAIGDATLQVRPHASNLFGMLITQIAHVIARSDQLAVCDGCTAAFVRDRAPSRGPRQYCGKCRKAKVPQRDASRDWRRRVGLRKP